MPQTKKKRQAAADAPGPLETPSPTQGEGDVEEVDAQGNPIEGAHRAAPTWTKVVLQVEGNTAAIGVQDEGCDPAIYVVTATLAEALGQVPELVERARLQWAERPQYPAYERPAPPPRPAQQPAAQRGNVQQRAAPAAKAKTPEAQNKLF